MIQRVQSIWLFLASVTLFMLLILPVATTISNDKEFWILVGGLYQKVKTGSLKIEGFLPLMVSTIIVALLPFINIFNYKNRTLQKNICNVVIILIICLGVWISQVVQKLPGGLEAASYNAGAFMPILAIIFSFLAASGIKKDERLIKSADRLR